MNPRAILVADSETFALREAYRLEMNCQIVHDSIHRRPGWTRSYLLEHGGEIVGFGSVAIDGPWKEKPTVLEYYLRPASRTKAFELFEAFLSVAEAGFMEIQSNDLLPFVMIHAFATNIESEKIVFRDHDATRLVVDGAKLQCRISEDEIRAYMQAQQGGPEWVLELKGEPAGQGGLLFHYNRPYGDIYMEIAEPFRRRGLGAYLVQEVKRMAQGLGIIPGARCSPANIASRRTLQKAGFAPFAHMLTGRLKGAPAPASG